MVWASWNCTNRKHKQTLDNGENRWLLRAKLTAKCENKAIEAHR